MASVSSSSDIIRIDEATSSRIRSRLFGEPREINAASLSDLESIVASDAGEIPSAYIDEWYRTGDVARYESAEAAAAYLGAYGPRSILKYQESVFALLQLIGGVAHETRVVDYGAGPCPGFAALVVMTASLLELSSGSIVS